MTIPKELVDQIIRTHTDSKAFYAELCRVTAILRAGDERMSLRAHAHTVYEDRCAAIDLDYIAVVNGCGHEYTRHNQDPSGNNDSSHTCLICRKELP